VATSIPLPAGLPLDATSWDQTPLVVRQLLIHLLDVIQQQAARIAALEARVSQNSSNSDRPPSSDLPFVKQPSSSPTKGIPGAKPGHPGHCQALLAPTEVIKVQPEACPCGQTQFPDTTPYYTHQVIELPEVQMSVKHMVLHEACCPQCGCIIKASLPNQHRYGYGPRLTALIGELSGGQRDSRTAVQEFCTSVLGVPISRGAIQRAVDRVSEAIQPHYEAIAEQARGAQVNYIDETAWYQHGVLAWLWVMVNTTVALFTAQSSRSTEAFERLVERWAGILVSDGYGV
jgi:transposase